MDPIGDYYTMYICNYVFLYIKIIINNSGVGLYEKEEKRRENLPYKCNDNEVMTISIINLTTTNAN